MKTLEGKFDDEDWIPKEPAPIPRNYPVVNLGMDRDIQDGLENLAVAEGAVNRKWKWDGAAYQNPSRHNAVSPYYDMDSVLEDDIRVSQKNLAATEKVLETTMELP